MLDQLINIYDRWAKGGRAKDLEQLAKEFRFKYQTRVDFGKQPSDIKSFKLFSKKGIKRFMGVMETDLEKSEGTVRFYDYIRTKDLETFTQSVVEVYCEDISTHYFKISPVGFMGGIKKWFGSTKKIHGDAKLFHKVFYLETDSEEVQYVLNKKALDLLMDYPKLKMEAKGHCFVFYLKKGELPIGDIMPLVDFAEEVVGLMGTGDDEGYV